MTVQRAGPNLEVPEVLALFVPALASVAIKVASADTAGTSVERAAAK